MSANIATLFKPIQLGSITLKNRIFMSALTRNRSIPTNVPNDVNLEYYKQRAAGGAGLIVSEGTLISQQGTEWPNAPGIWSKEQVAGWKKITESVHAEGVPIFAQIWHVGRVSHPDMPEQKLAGEPVWAPSAVSAQGGKFRTLPGEPGYVQPTAVENPETLVALYKKAAINAKEAGFDGVEVHGANGYLIHQFLDSTSNIRTDKWGGSIENRARFGLEVLKAAVEVYGPERVGIKLSPVGGYNDVGMPLEETTDTFTYFITEALKLKIGYIDVVRHVPAMDPKKRGTPHDVVAVYGPLFEGSSTLFFSNGGFNPEEAAQVVDEGKVQGVFFGFLWIGNPDLAKRVEHGKSLNIQPDFKGFYLHDGTKEGARKGYTDYPNAE